MRTWAVLAIVLAGCSQTADAPVATSADETSSTTVVTATSAPTSSSSVVPPSGAIGSTGPTGPTGSAGVAPATTDPEVVTPSGFARSAARITAADGTVCHVCVWRAETGDQRSQGLMFVTDLGAADAMAFVYPSTRTGTFWMKNTLLPLSIAFFDPAGGFLESFDMEPCTTDECPRYPTAPDFLVALEVPQGELDELGISPGSTLELLDATCDDDN